MLLGAIPGAILGLLAGVCYTLFTGKLTLTKRRIVYGVPARAAALLALAPLMFITAYAMQYGGIQNIPNGFAIFIGGLAASIGVVYAVGWPFGEPPRT